jgi:hypothetical protein
VAASWRPRGVRDLPPRARENGVSHRDRLAAALTNFMERHPRGCESLLFRQRSTTPEGRLLRRIVEALRQEPDVLVWRNTTGVTEHDGRRVALRAGAWLERSDRDPPAPRTVRGARGEDPRGPRDGTPGPLPRARTSARGRRLRRAQMEEARAAVRRARQQEGTEGGATR